MITNSADLHRKHLKSIYNAIFTSKSVLAPQSNNDAKVFCHCEIFLKTILAYFSGKSIFQSRFDKNMKNETKNLTESQKDSIALQEIVFANMRDINNTLTTSSVVPPVFHNHFVQMETGEFGIADLIAKILRERGAEFTKGIEETEARSAAVLVSMFTDEILDEVKRRFTAGSIRYPDQTVRMYLSVFMAKIGRVGKIKLSNAEDSKRTCCKPRTKWYLVKSA